MEYIIISLLFSCLFGILGYAFGKMDKRNSTDYRLQLARLDHDVMTCKKETTQIIREYREHQVLFPGDQKFGISSSLNLARAIFGKQIMNNDLTVIEGITPKIEQLLHSHNIATWENLSKCSIHRCRQIMYTEDEELQFIDPVTWPEQARLAFQGRWIELYDWQEQLNSK